MEREAAKLQGLCFFIASVIKLCSNIALTSARVDTKPQLLVPGWWGVGHRTAVVCGASRLRTPDLMEIRLTKNVLLDPKILSAGGAGFNLRRASARVFLPRAVAE